MVLQSENPHSLGRVICGADGPMKGLKHDERWAKGCPFHDTIYLGSSETENALSLYAFLTLFITE
jgi:hypothetical protein